MPILCFAGLFLLVLSIAAPSCQTIAPDPASSSRVTLVFNGVAVRDNQAGLVWEEELDAFMTSGVLRSNAV